MARSHAAKVRSVRPTPGSDDLVARAEAAMAELSTHFAGWMQDECHRLQGLCRQVEARPSDTAAIDQLYRAAHDIKGEAATFAFPAVEHIAASLCRLLSIAPDRASIPFTLIERHVGAAMQALHVDSDSDALVRDLEQATTQFLRDAIKIYPEVDSPPLAP